MNYEFFRQRVCVSAAPWLVPIGARRLTRECTIEELGLLACIANCIIGVGLCQGLEFILRTSASELIKHAGIGASRSWNCFRLMRKSKVRAVHLGRDPESKARSVLECASQTLIGPLS